MVGPSTSKHRDNIPNSIKSVGAVRKGPKSRNSHGSPHIRNQKSTTTQEIQHECNEEKSKNLLVTLKRFDTVFMIDDCASMKESGLWQETTDVLKTLARKAIEYDSDGIDVCFLNDPKFLKNAKTWEEFEAFFDSIQPLGESSPVETKLENILNEYLDELEGSKSNQSQLPKPLNVIVIGDGSTDDHHTLICSIVGCVKRLDEAHFSLNQIGLQFVQVGKNDQRRKALKRLDDDLQSVYGLKRDIVDTTNYTGELSERFVLKALLGGINRVRMIPTPPYTFG
ncbi:hypothetical protein CROQUDRAFT_37818 [Cronartium quercuum f. sp. fusiforme G11]|uniref:VWFA domain-containing protein n=1 Tax=Cronartium quercuum f. sp. fusiforme G11 TaxID=708437 RepID=A0A9P6NP83_9BASI|nr:hypothetical protein CROQUDRAFT_37818 [Cronartium quercuum f. sp. fusiforme G11]